MPFIILVLSILCSSHQQRSRHVTVSADPDAAIRISRRDIMY